MTLARHSSTVPPLVRFAIRRDAAEVCAIARAALGLDWTDADLGALLRPRERNGLVAERGGRVVGFAVYELHDAWIELLHFAVAPAARRTGAGRALVTRVLAKLYEYRRREYVSCAVSEKLTPAHLFLRRLGFRATAVFPGAGGDVYEFEHRAK